MSNESERDVLAACAATCETVAGVLALQLKAMTEVRECLYGPDGIGEGFRGAAACCVDELVDAQGYLDDLMAEMRHRRRQLDGPDVWAGDAG